MTSLSRAPFFIKPESIQNQTAILKRIESANLTIEGLREMIGTPAFVDFFYGHLKAQRPEVYEKLRKQFLGKVILGGVVIGPDAVRRFLGMCGTETAPAKNPEGTIRRDYGVIDSENIHFNAIHRATDDEEAKRQLQYFDGLL